MVDGVLKALEDERLERRRNSRRSSRVGGKAYSVGAKKRYNDLNASIDEYDTKIELKRRELRKKEVLKRAEEGQGSRRR